VRNYIPSKGLFGNNNLYACSPPTQKPCHGEPTPVANQESFLSSVHTPIGELGALIGGIATPVHLDPIITIDADLQPPLRLDPATSSDRGR